MLSGRYQVESYVAALDHARGNLRAVLQAIEAGTMKTATQIEEERLEVYRQELAARKAKKR